VDSYYYTGENLLALRKHEDAIAAFRQFLERKGDPKLEGAAHYWVGDALYSLKKNVEAKHEFDQGRRLDPDFPGDRPLLMFHIGESYYENADFETARLAYRQLLEKYPDRTYSKLVGLRLGDFQRDEGKEQEALQTYLQVIQNAPPAIALRGKLRIANIYANRPAGDDWKRAVALYDEVLATPGVESVAPEAQLRKALTLTLHNQNRDAIAAFEALAKNHPASSLVRDNIVKTSRRTCAARSTGSTRSSSTGTSCGFTPSTATSTSAPSRSRSRCSRRRARTTTSGCTTRRSGSTKSCRSATRRHCARWWTGNAGWRWPTRTTWAGPRRRCSSSSTSTRATCTRRTCG
jgi:TolA-binding protein